MEHLLRFDFDAYVVGSKMEQTLLYRQANCQRLMARCTHSTLLYRAVRTKSIWWQTCFEKCLQKQALFEDPRSPGSLKNSLEEQPKPIETNFDTWHAQPTQSNIQYSDIQPPTHNNSKRMYIQLDDSQVPMLLETFCNHIFSARGRHHHFRFARVHSIESNLSCVMWWVFLCTSGRVAKISGARWTSFGGL